MRLTSIKQSEAAESESAIIIYDIAYLFDHVLARPFTFVYDLDDK